MSPWKKQFLRLEAALQKGTARLKSLAVKKGMSGGKSGKDVADLAQTCVSVGAYLNQVVPEMEESFLSIGNKLEALHSSSSGLTGHCGELLTLASGSQEGAALLSESLGILKEPLDYIDYCMSEHVRLLTLLEQCELHTKGMLNIGSRMHDAIAPLTFMAVMFKIESAYLPLDMRETFTTVTVEVERLHKLVDETFTQNARQLQDAYKTLSEVRVRLSQDFNKQARVITEKRKRIDTAILTFDSQMAQNSERDSRLHAYSSALSDEVSKVVVGVQFYDIVKQKCDHVSDALIVRDGRISGHQVQLQIRQLQSVEADFDHGFSVMSEGLSRIVEHTDRLNTSSVSLENFKSMTAAVDGMVQSLLDALGDVHEIIEMVHQLAVQGNTAVQPANGIARNLTTAINELSINMRLIALNAQIRSVQGGQGTGLELLAARTAEISDQINEISNQVADDLSKLHGSIDEMLLTFDEFLKKGESQREFLGKSRGSVEKRLHGLRDRALTVVSAIGENADEVHASVAEVRKGIEALPALRTRFGEARTRLESIVNDLEETTHDSEQLRELSRSYTMASERHVHDKLVAAIAGEKAAEQKAAEERPSTIPQAEVEFFAEAKPAPVSKTTAAPEVKPADNVEFF